MRILGIDTSTKFLCLGLYAQNKIYEYNLEVGIKLSSLLDVTIKRVLAAGGLHIQDIDYFACGLGPGSFTGLRVGLAAIKGMSWALKKPVVGISTLDILARNAPDTDKTIVPIIDAKRKLIYTSVYKKKDGRLTKIRPYMLLSEEDFFKKVKNEVVILGDAIDLYREKLFVNIKGVTILAQDYWYPKGSNIIELALEKIKDKKFGNPFQIKPIYLYPKECQIRK